MEIIMAQNHIQIMKFTHAKDNSPNLEFVIKIEKKRMLLLKPSPNSPLVHPKLTTPNPNFVLPLNPKNNNYRNPFFSPKFAFYRSFNVGLRS